MGLAFARHTYRIVLGAFVAAILVILSAFPVTAAMGRHISDGKPVAAPMGAVGLCEDMFWACASAGEIRVSVQVGGSTLELAKQINSAVNRQFREVSDRRQYRREEHWALPTRRGGDCEDFALLKKRELIKRGVSPNNLLIATVLDRNHQSHAVLVVRTAEGDFVLDNLRRKVLHWSDTGYTYLRMQDPRDPSGWMAVLAGGLLAS